MIERILLYNSGGGIGDSIQLFPLILSLKNHFKQSEFFYLGAHDNHYQDKLKNYNVKLKTLSLKEKTDNFIYDVKHFPRHLYRKIKKKII